MKKRENILKAGRLISGNKGKNNRSRTTETFFCRPQNCTVVLCSSDALLFLSDSKYNVPSFNLSSFEAFAPAIFYIITIS
jgi:hypothetical protein